MSSFNFDLKAIETKLKQLFILFVISVLILFVLVGLKGYLINKANKEYTGVVESGDLGSINPEEIKNKITIKLNKDYPKGFMAGNSQSNLEQGLTRTSLLANNKSQLAYHDNIVFRAHWSEELNKYTIKIVDEKNNDVLYSSTSSQRVKSLIALDGYYIYISEGVEGDEIYLIEDFKSSVKISPNHLPMYTRINSIVTDGNKLYFTDGSTLFSTDLAGNNLVPLVKTSSKARIVSLEASNLLLDDNYTLYSYDVKTGDYGVLMSHNQLYSIVKENEQYYGLGENGTIYKLDLEEKNTEKSDLSELNLSIAVVDNKLVWSIDNSESDMIVSIYSTNNFIYLYNLLGNEEITKIPGN